MPEWKQQCLSCQRHITKPFAVCLQCVCCVPDCENVGLFHSLCFGHWMKHSQTLHTPKRCGWACWSCKQLPQDVVSRNFEELLYIYEHAFKPRTAIPTLLLRSGQKMQHVNTKKRYKGDFVLTPIVL